jgi:hypothetical protein
LIKKGKTDLRRVFSALNYRVIVKEDIEVNIKDQFYCILNKEPIFYFIHFIRQLMPFEDCNALEKYEFHFGYGIEKTFKKGVETLYLQIFNMIGVYWIASNYHIENGIDRNSIRFISKNGDFEFVYDLDSSKKGNKYYVTNIYHFSGKTSELHPFLSDEEIKSNYLLRILFSKVINLIKDRNL